MHYKRSYFGCELPESKPSYLFQFQAPLAPIARPPVLGAKAALPPLKKSPPASTASPLSLSQSRPPLGSNSAPPLAGSNSQPLGSVSVPLGSKSAPLVGNGGARSKPDLEGPDLMAKGLGKSVLVGSLDRSRSVSLESPKNASKSSSDAQRRTDLRPSEFKMADLRLSESSNMAADSPDSSVLSVSRRSLSLDGKSRGSFVKQEMKKKKEEEEEEEEDEKEVEDRLGRLLGLVKEPPVGMR